MPERVSQSELTERVIVETAIIMLSSSERDLTYGNEASWTYIETHLGGENDRKACLHVLKQEARALTCLGADCIRIGSQGSKELCSLLRNIEPNAGDEANSPSEGVTDSGIVLWINWFHGPVDKGYGFLQSFKAISAGMSDKGKRQEFSGLLENKVLSWFLGTKFKLWRELEEELLSTWCIVMSSTTAIVEVAKIVQEEQEHIRVYASKFEEYKRFFWDTLTEEAIIAMFLNNVHKVLRIHAMSLKRSKLSWDAFLREITWLDNEEPREAGGSKSLWKKSSLALEIDKSEMHSPSKEELTEEIAQLKRQLEEEEGT